MTIATQAKISKGMDLDRAAKFMADLQIEENKKHFEASQTGARREKLNELRYDYMPARIVNEAYARVADFGAKKYTKHWEDAWQGLLNAKDVESLKIILPKGFVNLATTKLNDPLMSKDMRKILAQFAVNTDGSKSRGQENVVPVTINGSKKPIQIMLNDKESIQNNGILKTNNTSLSIKETDIQKETLIQFLKSVTNELNTSLNLIVTGPQSNSTTQITKKDVQYVDQKNIYILITTTKRESTEVFYALNTTTDLDFSETIYKGLKEHCSTLEKQVRVKQQGIDNWAKGLPVSQLSASLERHLWAYLGGEDNDPESGLSHTDHILWNAVALAYANHHKLCDDRFEDRIIKY